MSILHNERFNRESAQYEADAAKKVFEQLVEIPTNSQKYFFTYLKLEDMYINVYQIMGNNFDIVDFHKTILDCGPIPLRFVEEIVNTKYSI